MEQLVAAREVQDGLKVALSWKFTEEEPPRSRLLERGADAIARMWQYPLLRSPWACVALLFTVAAICGVRAWIGLTGVQMFTHDVFMPLDGAWRMLNGQRPHIDFYSFIGVLAYAPTALGLLISHGGAEGFGYAQALVGAVLGCWAFSLTRRRLPDVHAALFTLAAALFSAAPFASGYTVFGTSPAMVYNRYGYVALALILLESLAEHNRREYAGGFSTGALAALLLFLKPSYFLAALFFVAVLIPCRRQQFTRWIGMATSFAVVVLAFCAYFGFQMMPMFRDFLTVAGAKRIHPSVFSFDTILTETAVILGFTIVTSLVLFVSNRKSLALSTGLAGVAVCIGGTLVTLGNCEPHGLPLSLFFLLIAIAPLGFRQSGIVHLLRGAVLLWATVFLATAFGSTLLGFGYSGYRRIADRAAVPLNSPLMRKIVPVRDSESYRDFVNDGIQLLNGHRRVGDTVMSLDFSNPFSYGLGMKPAYGGTTALHFQTTFSDAHRQSAEQLFGKASLVMVPNKFSDPTLQDSVLRLYGGYLAQHFRLVGGSKEWRLYRQE